MSVVAEIVLQRAIIDGFSGIRKNPKVINALFKNLPVLQQEAIKDFILNNTIDFNINYPKTDVKVPAIIMLMKTESESNNFLGDLMGAPPNYEMPDADLTYETLGSGTAASVSTLGGLPDLVVGSLSILEMLSESSLTFTPESSDIVAAIFSERSTWPCLKLHVVAGAGAGQTKLISSITNEQLDIAGTFELDLDSTSVVDIRLSRNPEAPYGEPVRSYEDDTGLLRIGANYDAQYQLEVLAGNQEEVIYLYTVLKSILFAQRKFLEAQGLMAMKLSGTDLSPRTELLPDEIFTRSMTLQFTYPFHFLTEQDVAREIQITFTSVSPNEPVPGQVILARIEL